MTTSSTTKRWTRSALGCALCLWTAQACWPEDPELDGSCEPVPRSVLDCNVEGYTDDLLPAGLQGWACTGSARPDYGATIIDGVPQGLLCADKGPLENGDEGYCCTEEDVPCAVNTAEECAEEGEIGYQCWGNNRPESLNPAILCTNGTQERGLYHYCCSGRAQPSKCSESAAVGCTQRLLGFLCEGDALPRGEDYGANRSRADYYYPMCTTAMPAPNPEFHSYCCYMYLPVPQGGTCRPHPYVPGCEPGRFGFSCYGPDHPEDNFTSFECPDPGFDGVSHQGYDATLYCCDFI